MDMNSLIEIISRASTNYLGGKNLFCKLTFLFIFILGIAISCLLCFNLASPFQFLPSSFPSASSSSSSSSISNQSIYQGQYDIELEKVIKGASMKDKTVILTTLNEAWAETGSILDVFLESFKIGKDTNRLLNHLVIISLDEKAHTRCLSIHLHCYFLRSEGLNFSREAYFMTPTYLEMMWRRIHLLSTVLMMGYNFVFTDADVMWLQDPFRHFNEEVDFQIACDYYLGHPEDRANLPNGGFNYVKSNNRSIEFYKYWYASRLRFPGNHDQDVLNQIKVEPFIDEIGVRIRFLDTRLFGGFCQPSRDFNLACTMHANCCVGLENKVHDLKIILQDWRRFMLSPTILRPFKSFSWRAPDKCRLATFNPPP